VVFIFSDRGDGCCEGEKIALENGLPYFSFDIRVFHATKSLKRSVRTVEGLAARRDYDRVAAKLVRAFEVDVIALGGYMSYTTLQQCVNVHPADLSICLPDGRRKFVGDHAVRDAILSGESELRASTLWTDEGVDTGPLLMVSESVPVEIKEPPQKMFESDKERFLALVDEHQNRLKEKGDWKIFPRTIEMIAQGRFARDNEDRVYVDGLPVPHGCRE
jgi:folate-dependent phosphoribosylglycinamide formyltransferase PurN